MGSSVDSTVGEGINRRNLSCPQPDEHLLGTGLCGMSVSDSPVPGPHACHSWAGKVPSSGMEGKSG